MSSGRSPSRGFSLIELAITLLVLGLVLAISVPSFMGFSQSHQLRGTTENVAGQLRLMREKAIATGATQTMHFTEDWPSGTNYDYHIHNGATAGPYWAFPNGIRYYTSFATVTQLDMMGNGRCQESGLVILQDRKGRRDTVAVQVSGLVLTR